MDSSDRTVTEVVVIIRKHIIPARRLATLDIDKLESDERTTTSCIRKVFLDRKPRVSIASDPNS